MRTIRARKVTTNTQLKSAIALTGRKQRVIAAKARLHEVRLSKIVTGRDVATPEEQTRILAALAHYGVRASSAALFPEGPTVAVAAAS